MNPEPMGAIEAQKRRQKGKQETEVAPMDNDGLEMRGYTKK